MSTANDKISDLLHDAQDDRAVSRVEFLQRFETLEGRTTGVERAVEINTKITSGVAGDTAELLDLFKSVKGGFKVMGWLGNFAKWVSGIMIAFAAIYAFVHNIKGGP